MLALAHPSFDHYPTREPQRRTRGAVVWQAHTEGFATTAYCDGQAIAGISGPWSNQYVLIWRQPSLPTRKLEVFDSLAEAKHAVALAVAPRAPTQLDTLLARLRRDYVVRRPSWLGRIGRTLQQFAQPREGAKAIMRGRARHVLPHGEETDLRGLNLRAVR
jgi:hypothetical protein